MQLLDQLDEARKLFARSSTSPHLQANRQPSPKYRNETLFRKFADEIWTCLLRWIDFDRHSINRSYRSDRISTGHCYNTRGLGLKYQFLKAASKPTWKFQQLDISITPASHPENQLRQEQHLPLPRGFEAISDLTSPGPNPGRKSRLRSASSLGGHRTRKRGTRNHDRPVDQSAFDFSESFDLV